VGIKLKSVLVWHDEQDELAAVGMWFVGKSSAENAVVLLWHIEQSPLVGCAPSLML
jgi:hypothetical protein